MALEEVDWGQLLARHKVGIESLHQASGLEHDTESLVKESIKSAGKGTSLSAPTHQMNSPSGPD